MTAPVLLRPYQVEALAGLAAVTGDAAQVHMACGSGKTLVALRHAEQIVPGPALIVVATPTLALVDQILRHWRSAAAEPFTALAVCSDQATDTLVHLDELTVGSTTDPDEVKEFLSTAVGRRVIATTYLSAPILAAALHTVGQPADLLVCDEAHHLTGSLASPTRAILDRAQFPARRRLFATATPRVDLRTTQVAAKGPAAGMDDELLFGPVGYRYPFGQAVTDEVLSDYRLAVIGVTEAELARILTDDTVHYASGVGPSLAVRATQTALLRAHTEHGVRRAITFHPTIAASKEFSRSLGRTLARLDAPDDVRASLTARHISGEMDLTERGQVLDILRHPPGGGWAVVSNARCLSEGVDIPAVDCVVFGHPKTSAVDIVQAVGRAMRRSPDGPNIATIVVPIVVDDAPGAVLDPGEYRTLWHVVRALRAHDEQLGIALDERRFFAADTDRHAELPDKITITVPDEVTDRLLQQISLMLIEETTSSWWDHLAAVRRFRDQHGHLRVPRTYLDPVTGYDIGVWIRNTRKLHGPDGIRLPAHRRDALNELGMLWHVYDVLWDEHYALLLAYRDQHGDIQIPKNYTVDDRNLGKWLNIQRSKLHRGKLRADRAQRLSDIGVGRDDTFARGLAALDRYRSEHGHADVPETHVDQDGYALGAWISRQRGRARGRKVGLPLSEEQRSALDERGMIWGKRHPKRELTNREIVTLMRAYADRSRSRSDLNSLLTRLVKEGVTRTDIARALDITISAVTHRIESIDKPDRQKQFDLTGKKFGRWEVLERSLSDRHGNARWKCRCECGTEADVVAGGLRAGTSKSCGCYASEVRRQPRR